MTEVFKKHKYDDMALYKSTQSVAACDCHFEEKDGKQIKVIDVPILTCECVWRRYQKEAEDIVAPGGKLITDPKERNKRINAAYAKIWLEDNRFQWAGLAAFASKQVGCGLLHAFDSVEKMKAEDKAIRRRRESLQERKVEFGFPELITISESGNGEQAIKELEQASKNNPLSSVLTASASAAKSAASINPVTAGLSTASDLSSLPSSPLPAILSPDEVIREGISSQAQSLFNHVYEMMALGNTTLFLDVYPLHAFYKQRGLKELTTCLPARKNIYGNSQFPILWPIGQEKFAFGRDYPDILLAFEAIEAGDIAQGVVHLANHEQLNILQPTMYSDKLLVGLLRGNHFSYVTNIFSGVRNISESVELTLASQCRPVDDGRTISFSNNKPYANLADVNQRMPFVLKAAARFDEMLHDSNRSLLEKSLQDIAVGRGVE
ncbi:DUF2515 family protein [Xenorhabdus bovienii]|uniref:Uncharacterized protein n=1 Tax=Xenorhabdus bovienii str. feltiae Moldova TaxID=1398200 RepID=A0A077NS31_XENBV|nr:hypothetical protein [Xenorhabdus bovienii]CDH01620.1 conserved hypothetical protein [Xenorhabdus bovienii str. feltiae Moldova]